MLHMDEPSYDLIMGKILVIRIVGYGVFYSYIFLEQPFTT